MVVCAVVDERSREWMIHSEDYDSEEEFRAAVADELARFEHIGFRTGRALVSAPIRVPIEGAFVTLAWKFQEAFMPAAKPVEPVEVVDPEPVAA